MNNPDAQLTTEQLANHMNMSPRNFFRLFKKHTGKTPAKCIEQLRLQFVKQKLENNRPGISRIASLSGFVNEERMRRTFLRNIGISPYENRKRFSQ